VISFVSFEELEQAVMPSAATVTARPADTDFHLTDTIICPSDAYIGSTAHARRALRALGRAETARRI
jgi:hypothetical protein